MINKSFYTQWLNQLLKPKVSGEQLHEELEKARQHLPVPIIWLLGKTQSGKSSIVQALTGATQAEIGEGFKPCTRTAKVYDFPEEDSAFVRFLDTRGLGERAYNPQEDMLWCEEQSHLLMVVVKAMDHQLDTVCAAVRSITAAHPEWPVLVVQTGLHEGYPSKKTDHLLPYPLLGPEADANRLPPDLLRSLRVQQQLFEPFRPQFIAVDFTREEDGYTPQYYGLEALWSAIETVLPLNLRQMLKRNQQFADQLNDVYVKRAYPHVVGYALSSGVAALTPIPLVGIPLVIAVQSKLLHSIASIYGLTLTKRSVSEILGAIGIGGLGVGLGVRELAKLIPGWGSAISGLSTAAMTYALGMTLCFYYAQTRQGDAFTPEVLKAVYERQLRLGRELLKTRFKQGGEDAE